MAVHFVRVKIFLFPEIAVRMLWEIWCETSQNYRIIGMKHKVLHYI